MKDKIYAWLIVEKQRKWIPPILYSVFTIFYTYPLPLHITSQIIGPVRGDNLEYVWKIWWVAHSIFDLHQSPFIIPDIYSPYGYMLAYGDITPIHTFLGIPLTLLLGPIFTYNMSILVSFVLTGYFTYLFVDELVDQKIAAFIAGLLFAFCNFRMARIIGHLPLMDTQWIILFLLFLERFIKKLEWKNLAYSGVFLSLAGLSTVYYPAMMLLIVPIFVGLRMKKFHGWIKIWGERQSIGKGLIAFGLICLVLFLPSVIPYLQVQKHGTANVPLNDVIFWSADISNYVIPNPNQFLWKDWIIQHLPVETSMAGVPNEYLIGLGFVGILFAVYGFSKTNRLERAGWGWWFLASFVLSLGPVLKILNKLVAFPVPSQILTSFNGMISWLGQHSLAHESIQITQMNQVFIPLPALFVRWFIPGFLSMRSWGRFSIFVMLGVAIWAGYGIKAFLEEEATKSHGLVALKSKILLGILVLFAVFESYNGFQALITPGPRSVDLWLAQTDPSATIIQMPLLSALSGPQMYYTQYHHHPVASGYGTYLPLLFKQKYPELEDFPADSSIEVLMNWGKDIHPSSSGVKFVLIDEAEISVTDPLWLDVQAQPRLVEEIIIGGVHVYSIQAK